MMRPAAVKPTITYGDFAKLDIRVGTIEKVEDVEGSDKLVRLKVNFGDHKRNILVGMKGDPPFAPDISSRSSVGTSFWLLRRARRENPKEIEGKQALLVVNLEPRKMMSTPLPPQSAGSADVSLRLSRIEMGEVSEGMLFDASTLLSINPEPVERVDIGYPDKMTPVLAVPEKSVPDGTRAG